MRKTILAVVLVLLWTVSVATAAELKVGDKAADFKLSDTTGKAFTLGSAVFTGKVISVFYADPGSKDTNNDAQFALKNDKGIDRAKYKGVGIVNLKASMVPNFILNKIIKKKQEEAPTAVILVDPSYVLLNLWGLKNKESNVIVLDKNGICRYIYKGKLSASEIAKLLSTIKEYQVK